MNLVFLGQAFTIMLVYVWSRRNPYVRMNFFGLLIFQAPFLPWVLMGFSLLLGNSIIVDLLGKQLQESQGSLPASVLHETRHGKTQGLSASYLVSVLYLYQAFLISKHHSTFWAVTRMERASHGLAFYCLELAQVCKLTVGISLLK